MNVDHATEAPAADTLILLETTWATWRFAAIRGWSASAPSSRGPRAIDERAEQRG